MKTLPFFFIIFVICIIASAGYASLPPANANFAYCTYDNNGNRITKKENGVATTNDYYAAFGETVSIAGTATLKLRFPGQYYDAETNINYNHHRYYDPSLGRFTQPDPIGFKGGTNVFAYVGNNPVRWIDPRGTCLEDACVVEVTIACFADPACAGAVGAGIGYAINAMNNNHNDNAGDNGADATPTPVPPANCPDTKGNSNASGDTSPSSDNPYKGPVDNPVIVVDKYGNAIPVEEGQSMSSSANGDYQQVKEDNDPTGTRLDRGGHRNQSDPDAQSPHGHRPGYSQPDGNPHLPIYY